jgi:SNF2 family DNA or RNA helicase
MGGYQNKEIVDYKNLKTLNKKLATVMLRRKKEDVIDLPEKIYSTEYVDLTKEEQKKYNQARAGILRDITSGKHLDTSMALTMILRLRQITAGIQSEEIGSKADRIRDLLEEEILPNKGKAIIFTNWSEVATMYRKLLADYSPAYIDGTVDAKQRQAEIDRFQSTDQCNIIIGTIGAMGTGVTLNKATAVIFADKAWTASDNMQAEDRAHRIGTVRPVNIISMVAKGTVDERIEERLVENKDLFEKVVNGKVEKTEVIKFLCDILGVDPLELKRAQKQAKKAEAEKAQAEKAKIAELDAYKRPELQMTGTN